MLSDAGKYEPERQCFLSTRSLPDSEQRKRFSCLTGLKRRSVWFNARWPWKIERGVREGEIYGEQKIQGLTNKCRIRLLR